MVLLDLLKAHFDTGVQFFRRNNFHRLDLLSSMHTDQVSIVETAVWPITFLINVFTALKGSQFYFLFAITAAGVVPCGGPKKSPRTSSIVQVIFSFWSFEISEDILRTQKFIIG